MADNSKISWTRFTWNPYQGCKKISPGCDFCYMYRDKIWRGADPETVVRSAPATFNKPLVWHKQVSADSPLADTLVFTSSWTDFFIKQGDDWRAEAWGIIKSTPNLTYQILTKRPHRIAKCLPDDWGNGYPNVWLGVTVENQQKADERIAILASIPARVRFLSMEPLLEPVRVISSILSARRPGGPVSPINWIIVGGESGNENGDYRYRPCEMGWLEQVISDSASLGIPVWMKQTGTWLSKQLGLPTRHGTVPEEWPGPLQIQQLPIPRPTWP